MNRLLLLIAVLSGFLSPALAGETLRVALVQHATDVELSAPEGLWIKKSSGETLYFNPLPSAKFAVSRGVSVNQLDTLEGELIIVPQKGGIILNQNAYSGRMKIKKKNNGLLVVNEVDVEDYLRGVVPAEMSPNWELEALKVQAVISRTYALYQRRERSGKDFDLLATVLSQVYQGEGASDNRATLAITATAGQVVTYQGKLASTFFHSTSAGPTEDAAERWGILQPYLKGVSCPLDRDSPYYHWKRVILRSDLEKAVRKMGHPVQTIVNLTPGQWSQAGRLLTLRIHHTSGEFILTAESLRAAVGYKILPSTNFTVQSFGPEIQIGGMGYGHGVGLCQWGAKTMAEQGLKFDEIVAYYYPGTALQPYEKVE